MGVGFRTGFHVVRSSVGIGLGFRTGFHVVRSSAGIGLVLGLVFTWSDHR